MGSIVVVRGYKLASLLIEEPAARLAGILLGSLSDFMVLFRNNVKGEPLWFS